MSDSVIQDCSLLGTSVHETLPAGILEWVAIPFSRRSSQSRDWTQFSHIPGRFSIIWATMKPYLTPYPCLDYCSHHLPKHINLEFSIKPLLLSSFFFCMFSNKLPFPGLGRSAGEGIGYLLQYSWDFLVPQLVKNPPSMRETWVRSLGW